MWQDAMVKDITSVLSSDARLRALFLAGSFGKNEADRYSDIDLVAVVAPAGQQAFRDEWKPRLQSVVPVVFWAELNRGDHIFNAVTETYQRIDLVTTDAEKLKTRGQDGLKPLLDRDGLYETLPETIPWPGPNKGRIAWLINEFIRVFGMLPIAVGRGEYLVGTMGNNLLRELLVGLLNEEIEKADKGGMLRWTKIYSEEQLALIASIPAAEPNRESIIAANLAAAKAFLPRARKTAERLDIDWPEAFENAAWAHIERELGIKRP